MGESNTLVTDFLENTQLDQLDLAIPEIHAQLFRHYTWLLYVTSEILTDFQDILTILRTGNLDRASQSEDDTSRQLLSQYASTPRAMQELVDYINSLCKHKTRNIHICNHHIGFCFEDAGTHCPTADAIRIGNLREFISRDPSQPAPRTATSIIVPQLSTILKYIVDGYHVVDEEFQADPARFNHFRQHYQGILPAPAAPTVAPGSP